MVTDHNAEHGQCGVLWLLRDGKLHDADCDCPAFTLEASNMTEASWVCTCCQGTVPPSIPLTDLLAFGTILRRIRRHARRTPSPLGRSPA